MKKSLIALAALASFAGASMAQVTLSGSVDFAVQNVNDQWQAGSAGSGRNALTFGVVEDLGGGMAAYGTLNHRFKLTDGTLNPGGNASNISSTSQHYRNAFMGLRGGFGDVRLGRHLGSLQDLNGNYDAFGTDYLASTHTGGINANVRNNGQISYRNSFGGLSFMAHIAPGENQTAAGGGTVERPMGMNVRFQGGPVDLGVAYDRNQADQKTTGVYGAFMLGATKLTAQFEKGDTAADDVKRWSVGAKIPMGNAALMAGYTKWSDEETNKVGLGVEYNLSKRTQTYATLGKLGGDAPSSTAKKARYEVGVTHKF
jgi:predicted porin